MTKQITQNERLDLIDVKEETEAYTKSMDIKEIMKQSIPDLLAENQRLKEQLKDYENALKKYADNKNWGVDLHSNKYKKWLMSENGFKSAQQILKKWGK